LELYRENEEAVFWSDAAECAEVCKKLLADEEWRKSIALRGRARYLRDGWQNEKVIARVISWMYGESKTFGKTDADFHSQQENASAVGS
jgi:hypothetical protein